ncbi:MAG: tRNA (N6-threonylcarbamoyladenosine(37)-N6)-methyltransferase TrmO [Methanocorpusculum sp.]|uniref:tRNA (N6-threonylcarbamoyladenosine(37)-N6)-methyltransferase TrmO n=1 Tax=Methanocorpusculum sp. TaxID=2058474 RepID=UPI0027282A5A|nr:tRNA (N6-threonylcarbamoyladenosine(37)-N6)-methyltransferase TrmO [Methanocorpusculum sp.]MDO9523742.1 tRNA (N6-threonylcarbamoyladenosine(37)-N6)-methyltransferase TrmO [Methanocorpusculum sp.]
MTEQFVCNPIGRVSSPYKEKGDAPAQGREKNLVSRIIIDPGFAGGLEGLTVGQQIFVLCWFDRSARDGIKVHPRGKMENPLTGVFNTRSPARPNPVSLTLVTIQEITDNILTVCGLDALDNTPVIDIKPYSGKIDEPMQA